ncbi:MAG: di-heme oxidoredictase family protein [Blastocatellia bacterium]
MSQSNPQRHRLPGKWKILVISLCPGILALLTLPSLGQLVDKTRSPNTADSGIAKSLAEEIGAGRGDQVTPDSSAFMIARDPFRSIRRGRQLFQRKFTRAQGQGPLAGDGAGDVNTNLAIGAGLADSCASCHGRPRGSGGMGGVVVTRPDSRDAPHLFGLGLKEMLADEITAELRSIRARALAEAAQSRRDVTKRLVSKGISYGLITAHGDGSVDTSRISGVDADLRVRPFFAHGGKISIREFVIGALNDEMGLQAVDPDLMAAHNGARVTTPSGMVLDGSLDQITAPPTDDPAADPDGDGVADEIPASLVDHLEFYLLNYFKPALYEQNHVTETGNRIFTQIGCAQCHVQNLTLDHDRRVADVETAYDPENGVFNSLFAAVLPLFAETRDQNGLPTLKQPKGGEFPVRNIFTDFKRHDVGPAFYERNYDGSMRREFLTTPLWGVGSTAPYGHDGRSINLREVILRHGGEAQRARDAFARLPWMSQQMVTEFLNSLVIFPPDDTTSTLDPGNRQATGFPQFGHGSIRLTALFNNPMDPE